MNVNIWGRISLKSACKRFKGTSAEFIVVSCVPCVMHLDERQKGLNTGGSNTYSIPVFDYNQILALCMDLDPKEVASISFILRDKLIEKI